MEIALVGEIDVNNAWQVAQALHGQVDAQHDVVVNAEQLEFIDVASCRLLVEFAERLPDGCKLVFKSAPQLLVRLLTASGWAAHPKIELYRAR